MLARGIDALASVAPGPIALEEAVARAAELVEAAAARVCRLVAVGRSLERRAAEARRAP